ncbi:The BTB (BR-C, ttk and bab)/POZ (Pox virus and Zinc finger) domain [Ceratobasidium sp. AG-Ba]|nr:The BTB (BR-C, ttk and bab)/POZ (Pox virus and Zinc finger) domain [Ceratobasidium sp. AG-Ba]QRW02115.1 The BTB (BR-C, ttk and bab)/POZ (Pox virus and Zinc finger) domain [Ceratobasidium sp. AG-Ba]
MSQKDLTHYYEDGNILIEIHETVFLIHQGKLCEYSSVFRDMFDIPENRINLISPEDIKRIELHDDLVVFTVLLDVIYQRVEVAHIDVKEQVQLALLANKYGMDTIQSECQSYLISLLPNSITSRDFHLAHSYEDDPSISPLVIRAGELLHMPEVLPWAVYFYAIQSKALLEPLSEENVVFRDSRVLQLAEIRTINGQAIEYWNRSFKRFIRGYCSAEWWDDEDECWRRSEILDTNKSLFTLSGDVENPLRDIHAAVDTWSPELCSLCADDLTAYANDIMARVLGRIGRDVLRL